MKYRIGDRLRRKPGSGFVGGSEPEIVVISDAPENQTPGPCLVCDEPGCVEWPTLQAGDGSGELYHISECELTPV